MAAVNNLPGPHSVLPGSSSVFHDTGKRDMAIQTGALILLISLIGFLLADGMAQRDFGPPVPASLAGVVVPVPVPATGLNIGDDVTLMGRWTLVCPDTVICGHAAAALGNLPGMPVQVTQSKAANARDPMPLIDPRGRVYARLDGALPRLDLRGLVLEIQNFFNREVLARLF